MTDTLAFASILCSRLCHDLVNPVGAVSNGIEMLADENDPDMRDQVLALLEQSARQVANRLQFFRLAFGAAGGMGETLAMAQIRQAAEALFADGKTDLRWQPQLAEISKPGAKLLLNLVLVGAESLLRGGTVTVTAGPLGGGVEIEVLAEGERVLVMESVQKALSGAVDLDTLDAKGAPAFLARQIATALGGRIAWRENGDGAISLTAVLP
ncbi:MAG: histidine phosphotransferase [Alphaproteobacteria bacterium]|nr:MAG: histidine phosphotransferase [Alphaproteobacteria bacterium]